MDLVKAKEDYDSKGYAVLPGIFSKEICARVREEAYALASNPRHRERLQRQNGHPALFFWPRDCSTYLHSISQDQNLRRIVEYFIGDNCFQLNNQLYYREAQDGDQFAWHQDICFRTPPSDFNSIETGYLQTIIVIDEITESNGAVEFIPGSHKWGDLNLIPRDNTEKGLRNFVRGKYKGVKVTAKPGDVMIWSVMTVHGSEMNLSNQNRMTYMNGFAADWAVKNKSKFPRY